VLLCEGPDQIEQFLLFGICATIEKGRDVLMFHLSSRRHIGFVTDEHSL
jgi:hypothetical protein